MIGTSLSRPVLFQDSGSCCRKAILRESALLDRHKLWSTLSSSYLKYLSLNFVHSVYAKDNPLKSAHYPSGINGLQMLPKVILYDIEIRKSSLPKIHTHAERPYMGTFFMQCNKHET